MKNLPRILFFGKMLITMVDRSKIVDEISLKNLRLYHLKLIKTPILAFIHIKTSLLSYIAYQLEKQRVHLLKNLFFKN